MTARIALVAALLCSAAAFARTTPPIEEGLRQALERATYSLKDSGHGSWHGTNRAQQMTLDFDSGAGHLTHPGGAVGFRWIGYGYGDRLAKPAPARLTASENRLEYDRGNLTEWYVNGWQGLEQGFTFKRRPGPGRERRPLVIALSVTGDLALERKDGAVLLTSARGVVLQYAGLTARDAGGRTLPSRLEVYGREIRLMVEDSGAQYPVVIDPIWTQQAELNSPVIEDASYNLFGYTVAADGNTAVIGAPYTNNYFGAAYVFVRSGSFPSSSWTLQAELAAPDGLFYDLFGVSVAVSGDIAIVGSLFHPLDENQDAGPGAAYVFARNGATWTFQQELVPSDAGAGVGFGSAASVSGNTAVIGSSGVGAWVYVQSDTTWTVQQRLAALGGDPQDGFGASVSVSGDIAVVGAGNAPPEIDGNTGPGAAYVFVRDGTIWTQQAELTPSDGVETDRFGASVSVSGGTAVIGAANHPVDSDGNAGPGAAYVFVQNGTSWNIQTELTASDGVAGDQFGSSVSVSGGGALIGARGYSGGDGPGAAYLFVQNGITWTRLQEITASDGQAGDSFGFSVALSAGSAVVGAVTRTVDDNIDQGAVYLFQLPTASLSIAATHSSPIFQAGPGVITLTVANTGGPAVDVVTVSDRIDSGFIINSGSPGCLVSEQVVTCTLAPNTFAASTAFNVYVTASASASASIPNAATLSDNTDVITGGSTSSDTIIVATQAPNADSSLAQLVLSGSTDNGTCAAGNRTFTATDQLQNASGSTLVNPYAVLSTLTQGNTLLSQSAESTSVSPGANVTFTFHIQLASCSQFRLLFDVLSN